jgi:hypothetical protein
MGYSGLISGSFLLVCQAGWSQLLFQDSKRFIKMPMDSRTYLLCGLPLDSLWFLTGKPMQRYCNGKSEITVSSMF